MKKKICAFFAVIFLITGGLGLIACNNDVSGTYVTSGGSIITYTYTIVLKSNGSCALTKKLSDETLSEYKGTYSVDGSTITFHLKWKTDIENEGNYSGTILKSGNIKLKFFSETLTYYKK